MTRTEMTHVSYRGSAPALNDLLAGSVDLIFDNMPVVWPQVQQGNLRALGVASLERTPLAPQIPAIAETLPGFEAVSWVGIVAPAGTPAAIVDKIRRCSEPPCCAPKSSAGFRNSDTHPRATRRPSLLNSSATTGRNGSASRARRTCRRSNERSSLLDNRGISCPMGTIAERAALPSTNRWAGANTAVKELDEDLWQFTTDVLFGEIWSRPGLSLRERELVTLATLMAAKADGIALHMRHAHNLGITFDEMKEVILQSTIYLGMPKALFAMRKLKAVMAEAAAGGGTGGKA